MKQCYCDMMFHKSKTKQEILFDIWKMHVFVKHYAPGGNKVWKNSGSIPRNACVAYKT